MILRTMLAAAVAAVLAGASGAQADEGKHPSWVDGLAETTRNFEEMVNEKLVARGHEPTFSLPSIPEEDRNMLAFDRNGDLDGLVAFYVAYRKLTAAK